MTATPFHIEHIHGNRWRVMKGKRLVIRCESETRAREIMELLMVEYFRSRKP